MAYTDLTSTFVYRSLLTYQLATDLALNDKLFNDQLTGAISIPNDVKLGNAKYLKGEVVATGSWKKLIGLDASNILQLAEAGTEVRLPADPTNVLGAATKQYVDGVQMFQMQPAVTANGGSGSYATILNLTATTRGHIRALYVQAGAGSEQINLNITIDGVLAISISQAVGTGKFRYLQPNMVYNGADLSTVDLASALLDIAFNTSLKVEAKDANAAGTPAVTVVYDKIP